MLSRVLQVIADPVRFEVLRLLCHKEELPQTALADRLDVSVSALGNHLAVLRKADLVSTRRVGRSVFYRLGRPSLTRELVRAVHALSGDAGAAYRGSAFAHARTCYDHLAGELGVLLYDRLVDRGALVPGPAAESPLTPGPGLAAQLTEFGAGLPEPGRRRLAAGCLDSTAGRPHLGGALGGELMQSFLRRGLLRPGLESRSLVADPRLEPLLRSRPGRG